MSQYYQSPYNPPDTTHYHPPVTQNNSSHYPSPNTATPYHSSKPQTSNQYLSTNPQTNIPYPGESYSEQPYPHHSIHHMEPGTHQQQFGGGRKGKSLDEHYSENHRELYHGDRTYSNIAGNPAELSHTNTQTNTPDATTFLTGSVPASSKGPGYYPPTHLQYSYSDKDPDYLTHPQPSYTNNIPCQKPAPVYKQKLSEVEVDRKRRRAMKEKLSHLQEVLPHTALYSTKQTHAGLLNKAAEYLRKEESGLNSVEAEIIKFTTQIEETKRQVAAHQNQIPENGISSACYGSKEVEEAYRGFLEEQGQRNPLMKLYSTMLEPLFFSFNNMVDNTSLDTFCRTVHQWFAQNCSLVKLRELATNLVTNPHLEFENNGEQGGATSSGLWEQCRAGVLLLLDFCAGSSVKFLPGVQPFTSFLINSSVGKPKLLLLAIVGGTATLP